MSQTSLSGLDFDFIAGPVCLLVELLVFSVSDSLDQFLLTTKEHDTHTSPSENMTSLQQIYFIHQMIQMIQSTHK